MSAGLSFGALPAFADLTPDQQAAVMQALQGQGQPANAPSAPPGSLLGQVDPQASAAQAGQAAPPVAMSEVDTQRMERQQAGPQDRAALGPLSGSPDQLLYDRGGMGGGPSGFTGSADPMASRMVPTPPQRPPDSDLLAAPTATGSVSGMNPGMPQGQTVASSKAVPGPQPNQYLPATPADRSAEPTGGAPIAGAFDPLTGQVTAGQPRPLGAPQGAISPSGAAAATGASSGLGGGGVLEKFVQGVNNPDFSNLMLNLGIGLLSRRGIPEALGAGLQGYQQSRIGDVKQQLEQYKLLQAVQGQQAQLNYLTKTKGYSPEAAAAMVANPTLLTNQFAQEKPNYQTVGGQIYDLSKNGGVPGQGNLIGSADIPLEQEVKKADALATVKDNHAKDDIVLQSDGQGGTVAVRKSSLFPDKGTAATTGEGGTPGVPGADPNIRTIVPPQPDKKANEGLDKLIGEGITGGYQKAQGAVGTLAAISRQKEALDKGVISGAGADWRTKAQSLAAQYLGIDPSQLNDSYNFDAASTQKQAELAKAVSQAGHTTNMDLALGKTIAGGDRSKTEQALRQIVDAQETLARDAIDWHNAALDKYSKIAPEAAARTGFFRVETPEVYRYGQGTPNPLADPGARLPASNAIPSLDVNQSHEFNGMKIRRVR